MATAPERLIKKDVFFRHLPEGCVDYRFTTFRTATTFPSATAFTK